MVASAPIIEANGARIPSLGLGTWQSTDTDGQKAVLAALEAGYRHIDTAARYGNEATVGAALAESGLSRSEYFVSTKVWYTDLAYDRFLQSAEASVERLGLDFVDLLFIHWPSREIPLAETMEAINEAKRLGITKHIGISNFTSPMLEEAVRLSQAPIAAIQCEYHPLLDQRRLLELSRAHSMAFISYSPMGTGTLLEHPVLKQIAEAHDRSVAQVILRWHTQQPGVAALPKSSNVERIGQNMKIFDFHLSELEMGTIHSLSSKGARLINPEWAPTWD
jgi:diketogulonate reductase-like aldo/keto reductase